MSIVGEIKNQFTVLRALSLKISETKLAKVDYSTQFFKVLVTDL